jgi:hypothetical protein
MSVLWDILQCLLSTNLILTLILVLTPLPFCSGACQLLPCSCRCSEACSSLCTNFDLHSFLSFLQWGTPTSTLPLAAKLVLRGTWCSVWILRLKQAPSCVMMIMWVLCLTVEEWWGPILFASWDGGKIMFGSQTEKESSCEDHGNTKMEKLKRGID